MAEAQKSSFIYIPSVPNPPIEEELPLPLGVKEPEIINTPNGLNTTDTNLPVYTFDDIMQKEDG